jgi:hypothetical protein
MLKLLPSLRIERDAYRRDVRTFEFLVVSKVVSKTRLNSSCNPALRTVASTIIEILKCTSLDVDKNDSVYIYQWTIRDCKCESIEL